MRGDLVDNEESARKLFLVATGGDHFAWEEWKSKRVPRAGADPAAPAAAAAARIICIQQTPQIKIREGVCLTKNLLLL